MNTYVPHKPRVLVVDDEEVIGMLLVRILRDYDVTVVQDGDDAVAEVSRAHWDAVLCDLSLPGVDGIGVWAAAGEEQRRRFIFMTGGAFTPEAQRFLDRAHVPIVDKPFEARAVRAQVARAVVAGVAA